jgi:hypothetical protein
LVISVRSLTRFSALSSRAAICVCRLRASRRRFCSFWNVLLVGAQRVVEHRDLLLELVGHVGRALLLDQRRAGEVLAVLAQRQRRLLAPVGLQPLELDRVAVHLLLVRDRSRRAGPDLDQRLLHLEDDHADHLGRVVGLVEEVVEVGGNDVAGTGKDAHQGYSGNKGIDAATGLTRSTGGARPGCGLVRRRSISRSNRETRRAGSPIGVSGSSSRVMRAPPSAP